ncbi:DUF348 domain-containing protein [Heliobacterium gestii]|uniref:DUF348 domain-containing protein n=1 Tax=Heliomicrobium gestii TaxID=2699 RepID=A0A845LBA2_HELGE|nr:3D domain-containing protein [Heliomicrobium gestii]MBM7866364.1 3D (Asp-Asp-Asp) domain-containing protein/uncharacterized protein YabE (DUF348 family) [Heliomicrobium gestii]MZP42851.1 DUF348 domain-containing protein [Heliomicrobium gestii]
MTIAGMTTKEKGQKSRAARLAIVMGLSLSLVVALFLAPFSDDVRGKTVMLEVDGEARAVRANGRTVGEMLRGQGIACEPGDWVYPDADKPILPGMVVQFRKSRWVELLVDNRIVTFRQIGDLSMERIAGLGVAVGAEDRLDRRDGVEGGASSRWRLVRLTRSTRERSEPVAFPRQVIYDGALPEGVERVAVAGADGVAVVREQVTFEDGQEVSAEAVEREVTQRPRPEVVIRGGGGSGERRLVASRGGSRGAAPGERDIAASTKGEGNSEEEVAAAIRRTMRMEATAYTHTGNRTATGTWPHVGIVAVDPSVIPLGSTLYVEGYGLARAADTGGAIRGSIIDVFFDSNAECFQWGRRQVTVHILE